MSAGSSVGGSLSVAGQSSDGSGGSSAGSGSPQAGATSGGSSAGGSNAGGSATGGATNLCDPAEPLLCLDDANLRACGDDGVYETVVCEEFCEAELRLAPGGCVTEDGQDGCDCGEPLNTECSNGADALCVCFQECTVANLFTAYLECDAANPTFETTVLCYAGFIMEDEMGNPVIDCSVADPECLAEPTP